MRTFFVFLSLCFFTISVNAQPAGYGFGKQLLIDSDEVEGATDLTDFAMLVNFTDTDLRTTANGGNVENSSGFDIVFTQGDCATLLAHQIEKYDPVTGEYIAWVKIPSLSPSVDVGIHMYYGNSGVSTDPSTTDVWDANHAGVWHMNQSPAGASPQLIDYTANTNDGIANGSMLAGDLVTGFIGDGIDFDGSNDFFDCGNDSSLDPVLDITVSAWIFSRAASGHIVNRGGGWDDFGYSLFHLSNRIRIELQRAGEKDIVDNNISINVWHHTALTYNNSTGVIKCFIDGVEQGSTGIHTGPMGLPSENLNIARKEQNAFYFNGIIDEARVIHTERSADWVLTEYNNQNSPSTFYTVSAEFTAGDLCSLLPIELINFSAEIIENNNGLISWQTASEINNDYFVLEKSVDFVNWNEIARIDGAGNSSQNLHYKVIDENLMSVVNYYRLRQVDFDGQYSVSEPVSLEVDPSNFIEIFPNPTTGIININLEPNEFVTIYNSLGQEIIHLNWSPDDSSQKIDLTDFPSGVYVLRTSKGSKKVIKY